MSAHIGRSFTGHHLEDLCPCRKEKCGLVDIEKANKDCEHHPFWAAATIRQSHPAAECWTLGQGASDHRVTVTDGTITKFECMTPDAACHIYPECECEHWESGHSATNGPGHAVVKHEDCWLQNWFDHGAHGTAYTGDDYNDMRDDGIPHGMTRTGPIEHLYDDCILWSFTDEEITHAHAD